MVCSSASLCLCVSLFVFDSARASSDGHQVFFAFCYPYSYSELQCDLESLDERLGATAPAVGTPWIKPQETADDRCEESPPRCNTRMAPSNPDAYVPVSSIFYHRELLTESLDGRRVDLITVSDWYGIGDGAQEGVDVQRSDRTNHNENNKGDVACHPIVFPERTTRARPPTFPDKPVVLISARVHPGETPASHTLQGFNTAR